MTAEQIPMIHVQPRTPAGVPTAGQFSAKVFAESQVALTTDVHSEDMDNVINFEGPLDSMGLQSYNYTANHFILDEQRDVFDLNPPYQRGSVWEIVRKQNLIRSILLGIPIGAIAMNKNMMASASGSMYDVIDGKQRIEAIRDFADSKFAIPSTWVLPTDIVSTVEVDGWPIPGVVHSGLSETFHRVFKSRPVAAVESSYKSYAEQAEIFRLINTGGVEQTAGNLANAASFENPA